MALFDFLKKIPTLNEINGSLGEWMSKVYLKSMPDLLVLHDVLIDGAEGYTSQIDLVLIGFKGIYVVEVKMFGDAKIYGDTKKPNWNYYKSGHKYEIYSPLKQNQKHVNYLKSFLENFGELPYFSVVSMICDDYKISGELGENTIICNSLPAMERALYKIAKNKPVVFDEAKKKEIYEFIKNKQYTGKDARVEHKENVIAYKKALGEMNEKICPYCKTEMVLRKGKNGEFLGCKNFPRCKFTLNK